ncbi:hypothetical protein, partial [Bacillus paralicheniformis]|uniref:hypothetical protein n=1 Tax=Bacillus paralicheniformis TaxID=1648923 RepID=UPI00196B4451
FLYSIKIRKNPILAPPKSHKIACSRRFFKTQNPKPNLKPKISPFQGDFLKKKSPCRKSLERIKIFGAYNWALLHAP